MKKTSIKIIIAAIVVLGIIGGGYAYYLWRYVNSSYSGEPTWVYVPAGTNSDALTDTLRLRLGDNMADRIMTAYKVAEKESSDAHGAYLIEPGETPKEIARRLIRRRQTPIKVTFNNLRTADQLAERVASQMEFSPEDFRTAMAEVLPDAGFKTEEFVAAFFPDTYEFYWTTPAPEAVKRLLKYRNDFWNDARRAQASALGLTPVKVHTICSIAEDETNARDERPTVARLYLNRVRKGMKLQADPTVKFALGDFSIRRVLNKHLETNSPYNTYRVNGLPPGPIRIVERRTIEDFLAAPDNDYIYMCAKEDFSGRHNFARDYQTHQVNARKYQQELNKRNIK
ncbi:MAG: endolytic transglycosylase MltG [Muribaculaceae bacterium]|nr:endolytic transglycosylase MltG [Muribaculaceae bacterium]